MESCAWMHTSFGSRNASCKPALLRLRTKSACARSSFIVTHITSRCLMFLLHPMPPESCQTSGRQADAEDAAGVSSNRWRARERLSARFTMPRELINHDTKSPACSLAPSGNSSLRFFETPGLGSSFQVNPNYYWTRKAAILLFLTEAVVWICLD